MIYIPEIVQKIRAYYGEVLDYHRYKTVHDQLFALSKHMHQGLSQGKEALYAELNNYNPDYIGKDYSLLNEMTFSIEGCRKTIALEFGFESWQHVEQNKNIGLNHDFEYALDLLLNGYIQSLRALLDQYPSLINATSHYGHQAQLIHYAGSNGVEFWRQVVPKNLSDGISLLIEKGADLSSTMKVYGGRFTMQQLFETSAHPHGAGIFEEVKNMLDSYINQHNG